MGKNTLKKGDNMKKTLYFILPILIVIIALYVNCNSIENEREKLRGEIVSSTQYGYTIKSEMQIDEAIKALRGKIVKVEKLPNGEVYYCIVNSPARFIYEKGKRYNCQIADNGLYLKVGFPLIDTGY